MRQQIFTKNPYCITSLFALIVPATILVVVTYYGNNTNSSMGFSLPLSSTWNWMKFSSTPLPSSSSNGVNYSSLSSDPRTSLYTTFKNPKMQNVVNDLVKELNYVSLFRVGKERDKDMEMVEASLAKARDLIKKASNGDNYKKNIDKEFSHILDEKNIDEDFPRGDIYRNGSAFRRSYTLMENKFKIFVYKEGEPPMFHNGPCKDIYSMEGMFLNLLEKDTNFQTKNPNNAHVYFLPFSVVMILQHLFDPVERDKGVLERVISDYVKVIKSKYPYWNRSLGADHAMLSCHDWGPRATWYVHQLYFTSIRALCNANTSEFFNPRKDVSFPEINLRTDNLDNLTTKSPYENRTFLAFFAGGLHGKIRPSLFQYWNNNHLDEDIKIYQKVPKELSYEDMMKKSKFCLCPSGHEVASPRIVEAIYAECVPVLISQNYILPFSDVLDWTKFSIQVSLSEVPNLKRILMNVSEDRYLRLQEGVRQVQRHFVVNDPPKRFDVFHMIVHSIWLRRLNVRIYG